MAECFISNEMLFTKYNPFYYQHLIQEVEEEINDMYTLCMPSTYVDDSIGEIRIGSYRVESLVISIIERKERLERIKEHALSHCNDLYKALSHVPVKYEYKLLQAQESGDRTSLNSTQYKVITSSMWNVITSKDNVIQLPLAKDNNLSKGVEVHEEVLL